MKNKILLIASAALLISNLCWAKGKKPPSLVLSIPDPYFSPNKDGVRDVLLIHVKAEGLNKVGNWELRVQDSGDFTKRMIPGIKKISPLFAWDGLDDFGAPLPEGNYRVTFAAWDTKAGIFSSTPVALTLDLTPPTASISQERRVSTDTVGLLLSAVDLSGIDSWRLDIQDISGKSIYVQSSSGSVPATFAWKPAPENFEMGKAVAILSVMDRAGNRGSSPPLEISFAGKGIPPKVSSQPREPAAGKYMQLTAMISVADLFGPDAGKESPLRPEAAALLKPLAETLFSVPGTRINILGHVDTQPSPRETRSLSSSFAWKTYSYFVKDKSIDKNLITVKGLGNKVRVDPERTRAGRMRNRRIEIQLFVPEASNP